MGLQRIVDRGISINQSIRSQLRRTALRSSINVVSQPVWKWLIQRSPGRAGREGVSHPLNRPN